MAKKKKEEALDAPPSMGALIASGATQRERNLAIKARLIAEGSHPDAPSKGVVKTQKERNLEAKAKLKGNGNQKG